jgi:hypothetical protein
MVRLPKHMSHRDRTTEPVVREGFGNGNQNGNDGQNDNDNDNDGNDDEDIMVDDPTGVDIPAFTSAFGTGINIFNVPNEKSAIDLFDLSETLVSSFHHVITVPASCMEDWNKAFARAAKDLVGA